MAGSLIAAPWLTFVDANGAPYGAGQRVFTYLSGTSTKASIFTDSALSVAFSNPIVLPSDGRLTAYGTPGVAYKFVLANPGVDDPPISPIKTVDPVGPSTAANVDINGVAGETITLGQSVYLSAGDGGLTAGRWYKTSSTQYKDNAANVIGFAQGSATVGVAVSVRISGRVDGLSGLTPGLVYYIDSVAGNISTIFITNSRAVGQADTTTSLVLMPQSQLHGQPLFEQTPNYKPGASYTLGNVTTYDAFISGAITGAQDTTARANGTTVETTLSTMTLAGATLSQGTLRVSFAWTIAANANTKTVRFYFGGTAVVVYTGVQNGGTGFATMLVSRKTNNSQVISGFFCARNAAGTADSGSFDTTAAETYNNAIVVKTTGQSGTASSDIIQHIFLPELVGV
jgi:hypothetical protein